MAAIHSPTRTTFRTQKAVQPTVENERPSDSRQMITEAGLVYTDDREAGIRRVRDGDRFRYVMPNGKPVEDEQTLARIRSLAVPPAYEDVWISKEPFGYLQATARDARGRKQYRYHARWRAIRDETKYVHLIEFGAMLPKIRERVANDLSANGLTRTRVLATIVRLLEITLIRVGNEEYARQNKHFGLTTLKNRHVDIHGTALRFHFRGKSGVMHNVDVHDRRVAGIVQKCRELPGQELFQYISETGERHSIGSSDVNQYLHDITGHHITAKDFRTWNGTVLAAAELRALGPAATETEAKRNIVGAVCEVSSRLGNTPSVCRKCYVHPHVIDSYMNGKLFEVPQPDTTEEDEWLNADELALLRLLRSVELDPESSVKRK